MITSWSFPKEKAWFAAKAQAWGWGLPMRWQGWAVLLVAIVSIVAGAGILNSPAVFVVYSFTIGAVVVLICFWKSEEPEWR